MPGKKGTGYRESGRSWKGVSLSLPENPVRKANPPDIQKQNHPVVKQQFYPVVRKRARVRQGALETLTERSVATGDGQPKQGDIFLFHGCVVALVTGLLP